MTVVLVLKLLAAPGGAKRESWERWQGDGGQLPLLK